MIARDILKENYVKVIITDFVLRERQETQIKCKIVFSNEWEDIFIEGVGSGVVDVLFTSIINNLSKQFFSLKQISFDDFIMEVKFKTNIRKSASPVEIKLALKNTRGKNIYFSSESQSMMKATIAVVTIACEYFINAEISILQLRKDIENAKKRDRNDLLDTYVNQMIDLVTITSYEDAN